MSERLPTLLHDLAGEMPVEMEPSTRRVVKRARARRFTTVLVSATTVLAVVVGGVSALRVASPSGTADPAASGVIPVPTPSPTGAILPATTSFPGLWPETTAEELATAQAQVDDGHEPLRLDPGQTAAMLATNLLGWQPDEITARIVTEAEAATTVEVRNDAFSENLPPITVELAQLGRTGADGVWTVVAVSTPFVDDAMWTVAHTDPAAGDTITVLGQVGGPLDSVSIRFAVLSGPVIDEYTFEGAATIRADDTTFELGWPAAAVPMPGAVLWIFVADSSGATLGATASPLSSLVALDTPGPVETPPPGAGETPLPAAVIAAHDAIQLAAVDHDAAALDAFVDPTRFAYNFGDAGPFARALRDDPSMFDTIAQLLALPFWVNDTEGTNVTYVWPAFMRPGALEHLSDIDRAQLHGLGFSDEQIDQMAGSGGYLGPRLGIDEDGTWIYFVTAGD